MVKIGYRSSSFDKEGNVKFSRFEVKMDEDLRFIWSIFLHAMKGPIEVNATLVRSINDILKILKHHQPSLDHEMSC